jgi:hypothetical protein
LNAANFRLLQSWQYDLADHLKWLSLQTLVT